MSLSLPHRVSQLLCLWGPWTRGLWDVGGSLGSLQPLLQLHEAAHLHALWSLYQSRAKALVRWGNAHDITGHEKGRTQEDTAVRAEQNSNHHPDGQFLSVWKCLTCGGLLEEVMSEQKREWS